MLPGYCQDYTDKGQMPPPPALLRCVRTVATSERVLPPQPDRQHPQCHVHGHCHACPLFRERESCSAFYSRVRPRATHALLGLSGSIMRWANDDQPLAEKLLRESLC